MVRPDKNIGGDKALERQGQGSFLRLLTLLAVVSIVSGTSIYFYREWVQSLFRERVTKVRGEMHQLYATAVLEISKSIEAQDLGAAQNTLTLARSAVETHDFTEDRKLWTEGRYQAKFDDELGKIRKAQAERSARVERAFAEIEKNVTEAKHRDAIEIAHRVARLEGDTERTREAELKIDELAKALNRLGQQEFDQITGSDDFKEHDFRHAYDKIIVRLNAFPARYKPYIVGQGEHGIPIDELIVWARYQELLAQYQNKERRMLEDDALRYRMREVYRMAEEGLRRYPEQYEANLANFNKVFSPDFGSLISEQQALDFRKWSRQRVMEIERMRAAENDE